MDKKYIQIFIGNQIDNPCGSNPGGCSYGCGTPTNFISIEEILEGYITKLAGMADFYVYNISDQRDNEELIEKLNAVLEKSGEKLVVDKSNLEFVLSQSAPIIAVDGRIISIKSYPDDKQLYEAVMFGRKIPVVKGCC